MNFVDFSQKTILVMGVANRKSVAWQTACILENCGAKVIYSVRNQKRHEATAKLLEGKPVYICDVEEQDAAEKLSQTIVRDYPTIDGILHSIAFANFSEGIRPFHETKRQDYLQATVISSFSLVEIARAFKPLLTKHAAVVAISISSLYVTAENYGYMTPIKAALEGTTRYLAKAFSKDSEVRFNTVNAGPLKTSASAGIPGYLENYLFAEKMTLRKRALQTKEVANTAVFLLSDAASGINGQSIIVNAGMDLNYFDQEIVHAATKISNPHHPSEHQ